MDEGAAVTNKIVKIADVAVRLLVVAMASLCLAAVLFLGPAIVAAAPGSPWVIAACAGMFFCMIGFHVANLIDRPR
jgi:hypothetical protein